MFGARVKLVDEDTDEEASYQVVGPDEADIQSGPALDPVAAGAGDPRQGGRRERRGDHAARRALFRDHRGRLQLSRTSRRGRASASPPVPPVPRRPGLRAGIGACMSTSRHTKVLIIGAGAAGLTAAIYAARANLAPVVIQGLQPGGQLTITTDVENYPGFAEVIQGPWLMEQMAQQATHCGAELLFDLVTERRSVRSGRSASGSTAAPSCTADALIIATGAQARWLGLDSERHFSGAGVSACATCDGFFFRGKRGGDRRRRQHRGRGGALPGADVREGDADPPPRQPARREGDAGAAVRATARSRCSGTMSSRRCWAPSTRKPSPACGVRHVRSGETHDLPVDGLFVAIGHDPATALFRGQLEMDARGLHRDPARHARGPRCGRVRGRRRAGQDLPPGGHGRRQRLHGGAGRREVSRRGSAEPRYADAAEAENDDQMMDWDRVRVFHAVAQAGSFTRAAERLGLSQSAISRQIGALEEDLAHLAVPSPCARSGADRAGRDPAAYGGRGRQAHGLGADGARRQPRLAGRPPADQHHHRPRHGLAGRRSCRISSSAIPTSASRWSSATATSISACARPTSRSGWRARPSRT